MAAIFKRILTFLVGIQCLAGGAQAAGEQPKIYGVDLLAASTELQPFSALLKLQRSQIREPKAQVIETQADWRALWKTHQGDLEQLPSVDFRTQRVIALFLGQKPTAGYSIGIEKISQNQVFIQVQEPPKDAFVAQVITAPAFFATVPRGAPLRFQWPRAKALAEPEGEQISFQDLSKITNSFISEKRYVVARDAISFRQLWHLHQGKLDTLPEVDFNQLMVIGIFMGEQTTGGYSVSIDKIRRVGSKLKVFVKEEKPSPDSMVIQILTAPAHLVVVPKTDAEIEIIWRD